MIKFEEELNALPVSHSTKYTEYWNKAQLLTVFKDWQPQQALPVVPECVDLFIKECREFNYDLDQAFYEQEDGSEATENNKCILWRRNHPDEFARAWLDGYTVEKPQLFYLRDELTGQFLAKDNQFKNEDRYFFWTGADPLTHSIGTAWKLTFTKQEIDSMETGSYELVPVEDGE